MTITTYLFDFDDTIISTKIYAELYQPLLKMVKSKLKLTNSQLKQKAEDLGLKKNKFDRWDTGDLCRELNLLEEYYQVLEKQIKVMPVLHDTVINTFKKIKAKKRKIAIVSNSMRRTVNAYLHKYELVQYLDFTFTRDDAQCKKRDDPFWQKLIKKQKLNPRECLVIGDDPEQDVIVPKKLGFNTFLIKQPQDLLNVLTVD